MRKSSFHIMQAFLDKRPAKGKGNSEQGYFAKSKIEYMGYRDYTDGQSVWLHGNKIAWHNPDNTVSLTLAGWGTPTTRERLNTLCQMLINKRPFHQKKHEQYYDESLIDNRQIFTIESIPVDFEG